MSAYEPLARAVGEALAPLGHALSDIRALRHLLVEIGWTLPIDEHTHAAVNGLLPVAASLAALPAKLAELASSDGDGDQAAAAEAIVALIEEVVTAVDTLTSLDADALADLPGVLADPDTWASLGLALIDYLLVRWLRGVAPVLLTALRLTGLCADELVGGCPRPRMHWERLQAVMADPLAAVVETVGWGGDAFEAQWIQDEITLLLARLGLRVRVRPRRLATAQVLAGGVEVVDADEVRGVDTDVILFSAATGATYVEIGLVLAATAEHGGALAFGNLAYGELGQSFPIADDWSLRVAGELDGTATLAARLAPTGVTLEGGDAAIDAELALEGAPSDPWILIGSAGGPRLELDGLRLAFGVSGSVGDPELWAEALVPHAGGRVVLDLGDDSFLADVIGETPSIALDFGLRWSSRTGLAMSGGVGFEVEIPVDREVGPLYVQAIGLAARAGTDGLRAEVTVTGSVTLGPIAASADRIGLALELAAAGAGADGGEDGGGGGKGLAGLEASLAFVPPTGFGLRVNAAGIVTGGGYLEIDHDAGRYAGIAELDIFGVGVTAIGILTTKLPDGSKGWSMFLSISAQFTGLQLGFGFTLNGVGGIIGINRGLDVDALGEGVRAGSLDSILFPDDPVADAPRILAELDAIFPQKKGQFVFGPIAKVGWGTPTLFEADLGVVVQLPEPLTISLLGAFEAVLPTKAAPVLELRLDVVGTLDLSAGTLSVDASLRDSRVVGLVLSGDMALRASFVDSPSFLLAFGGFNPHFTPPASFPQLDRLSIALDTGDKLRIGLSGYFALTSNTVQFGAGAQLWAKAIGLTVEGHFQFDALLQFNPFWFRIDLGFCVDVRAGKVELFGVALDLQLEGPNPWHVLGKATLKILGVKKSFRVEATLGQERDEGPRELAKVGELLVEAVRDPDSWGEAPLPADAKVVTFAEGDGADQTPRVHPAGRVELRQRVVPLDRTLDHYGGAKLGDGERFSIDDPRLGGQVVDSEALEDFFAPAQYFRMDEEEKISAPSFETMRAGLTLGGDEVAAGKARAFELDYEQVVRDPEVQGEDRKLDATAKLGADALASAVRRSLVTGAREAARLPTSNTLKSPFALEPTRFVIGEVDTGQRVAGLGPASSWSAARERLVRGVSAPAGKQIVPSYELASAGAKMRTPHE